MTLYRVYCLDRDGRLGLADTFNADNDEDAIGQARVRRPDAHKCEIWLDHELIAKINARGHLERVEP